MLPFILKRILISLPLLLGVAFLSFLFVQLAPGDYFDSLKANPQVSQETIDALRSRYHLDESFHIQFLGWIGNLFQGDLGYSFVRKAPVSTIIGQYTVNTLFLALVTLTVTWLVAIPLGILSASRWNRFSDKAISFLALLGMSFPSFIIAILLLMGASMVPGMPIGGMTSIQFENMSFFEKIGDLFLHLLIPATAIAVLSVAGLIRLTRANMLEVMKKPFLLAAHAQGLPKKEVHRQAFVNAMNPLITLLGYEFAALLGGSAIIEIICSWPGLGSVMLEAVMTQDLYLVMGGILMGSVMLVVGNLLADILLVKLDPRMKM